MPADAILDRVRADLAAAGLWRDRFATSDRAWMGRVIDLVKPRAKKLADIVPQLRPFIEDRIEVDPAAAQKHLSAPDLGPHLAAWRDALARVEPFDAATLEAALRATAETRGIKAGVLIHATRVAVTGQAVSPGIFDVLELIGRERVLNRLA